MRFALEKCEICTGEMSDLHWRNVGFALEKCEICTGHVKFQCVKFDMRMTPTGKCLELVLAEMELHIAVVLVLAC